MRIRLKHFNLLLALTVITLLVAGRLAKGECYRVSPSGKKIMLNTQVVSGLDCFTGRFDPPGIPDSTDWTDEKYGMFSFELFRQFFLGMITALAVYAGLLLANKKLAASIFVALAFIIGMVAAIYFDGFHNYYAEAARTHFSNFTFDVQFGWLTKPPFWLLFATLLFLNWVPLAMGYRNRRLAKRRGESGLIDN